MTIPERGSVLSGALWMFLLSLCLFWLPVLGPLVAGIVGGKKAGNLGNAIMAVFVPGLLAGVLLFLVAAGLTGAPLIGAVAGSGAFVLSLAHIGPLLLGAIIGGSIALSNPTKTITDEPSGP